MLGLRKSGGRFLDKSVLFSCFPSTIAPIRLPNDTICPSQDCSVQRTATYTMQCNAIQYNIKYNPMQSVHLKDAPHWTSVKYLHCIQLQLH